MTSPQDQTQPNSPEIGAEELALVHEAFFAQQNMALLLEQLPFALWVKDVAGRYVGANPQWLNDENIATVDDIAGKNEYDLFEPVRAAASIRRDWEMLDEGRPLISVDNVDRSGVTTAIQTTRMPLRDPDQAIVGVVGFTTATAILSSSKVDAPLEIDPVTGIGVQEAMHNRITEVLDSDQASSLLLFGLDDHGIVIDSLGHEFGDMLLRAAARRLTSVFGPHLFRNRVDEFAVVLPSTDRHHLEEIGETILNKWRQPLMIDGNEIYGSISIGTAPLSTQTRSTLVVQDAELAINEAKRAGGSRMVIYSPEHRETANDELAQQMLVRRAVSNKEFNLHWQPIVDSQTNRTVAFEALLRWRPAGGSQILPAAEFFPFLERSGLIVQLGKFVIAEACRQHIEWRENNKIKTPIPMYINVSARQFASGLLASDILKTLSSTGVSPDQMTIEVVESSIADPSAEMLRDLITLREAGVKIAIDDFGASHSSITSLSTLPIDIAKVDRRLTERIVPGADEPILDAFASVFAAQGITPIVQGVENAEQLEWLRSRGWKWVQGYFLGQPLDAHDITPSLAESVRSAAASPALH